MRRISRDALGLALALCAALTVPASAAQRAPCGDEGPRVVRVEGVGCVTARALGVQLHRGAPVEGWVVRALRGGTELRRGERRVLLGGPGPAADPTGLTITFAHVRRTATGDSRTVEWGSDVLHLCATGALRVLREEGSSVFRSTSAVSGRGISSGRGSWSLSAPPTHSGWAARLRYTLNPEAVLDPARAPFALPLGTAGGLSLRLWRGGGGRLRVAGRPPVAITWVTGETVARANCPR